MNDIPGVRRRCHLAPNFVARSLAEWSAPVLHPHRRIAVGDNQRVMAGTKALRRRGLHNGIAMVTSPRPLLSLCQNNSAAIIPASPSE